MNKRIRYFLIIMLALPKIWIKYLIGNPRRIKWLLPWLCSFFPGRNAFKDRLPWFTFEAIEWLDKHLTIVGLRKKDMKIFEWGSGGSSLFIVDRVQQHISIENNVEWYDKLKFQWFEWRCRYLLKEDKNDYVDVINEYPDNHFDLVLVDGEERVKCIERAMSKVKSGGYILLDDTEYNSYNRTRELLDGWVRIDFPGPKRYVPWFYQTTIWRKL